MALWGVPYDGCRARDLGANALEHAPVHPRHRRGLPGQARAVKRRRALRSLRSVRVRFPFSSVGEAGSCNHSGLPCLEVAKISGHLDVSEICMTPDPANAVQIGHGELLAGQVAFLGEYAIEIVHARYGASAAFSPHSRF